MSAFPPEGNILLHGTSGIVVAVLRNSNEVFLEGETVALIQ